MKVLASKGNLSLVVDNEGNLGIREEGNNEIDLITQWDQEEQEDFKAGKIKVIELWPMSSSPENDKPEEIQVALSSMSKNLLRLIQMDLVESSDWASDGGYVFLEVIIKK